MACCFASIPAFGIDGEERSCAVQQSERDLQERAESRPLAKRLEAWYFIQEEGVALVRGAGMGWWTVQGFLLDGAGIVVAPCRLAATSARNPSGFSGLNIKR